MSADRGKAGLPNNDRNLPPTPEFANDTFENALHRDYIAVIGEDSS
jgi:hypothetical protein